MNRRYIIFIVRWLFNSLGLWVAVQLLGTANGIDVNTGVAGYLLAGLIFSIVNSVIKPLIVILALPAILVTLGFFILIVNGLMVYISLRFTPGIEMTFLNSIFAGMILSLVNYIVSAVFVKRSNIA